MNYLDAMQKLNTCHGPSGDEKQITALLQHMAGPYADECRIDTMGNLILHKKGSGPKVMVTAHMDTVGFAVTHIDEDGRVAFGKLGDISPQSILHTPIRFQNGVRGVICPREGSSIQDMTMNDLCLDIGVENAEQARRLVQPGDTAVFALPAFITGSCLVSPYLDNRLSCAVLVDAMRQIRNTANDLYFVFSVQGELGFRGSKTAAFSIQPDFGIVLDVSPVQEGSKAQGIVSGGGAGIKVMDHSCLYSPKLVKLLTELALSSKIPCQKDIAKDGGTDGGFVQVSCAGVETGGVSIPCRYRHTPAEMAALSDVEASARLIAAFAETDLSYV